MAIVHYDDGVSYYMDRKLLRSLKKIKRKLKRKDADYVLIIDGPEGCQPAGSQVMMADGSFRNIEDIKLGDRILSPQQDGSHVFSNVKQTFKFEAKNIYDVYEMNRGKKKLYSCSQNHFIPIHVKKRPRHDGKRLSKDHYWTIKHYEAEKLYSLSNDFFKNSTTPTCFQIAQFENRNNCEIEPYTLGVYLGDGNFSSIRKKVGLHRAVCITSEKFEIIEEISKHYPIMSIYNKKNTPAKTYRFSMNGIFPQLLIKHGLEGKRSGEKFIPQEALFSDSNYRKRLLAGLIDTDGYLSKNSAYSITTKSKQMADDILSLIFSLGGRGKITSIKKRIKRINFEGSYFCVSFYLGNMQLPLKVNYKKRNSSIFYLSPNRISIKLEKKEGNTVYGFELDSKSHWYITDNFVITRNSGKSSLAMQIAKYVNPNLSLDDLCMTPVEFVKRVMSVKKGSCVVYDEAFTGLSSRKSLSDVNNNLVSLMMEMRQKNLFVIIVMPTFFMLDKYVALFRARSLIHVYLDKYGRRGNYQVFNQRKKLLLYKWGKPTMSYRSPQTLFYGYFSGKYAVDEKQYREKKKSALTEKSRTTKVEKLVALSEGMFSMLYYQFGYQINRIWAYLKLFGDQDISQTYLRNMAKNIQLRKDKSGMPLKFTPIQIGHILWPQATQQAIQDYYEQIEREDAERAKMEKPPRQNYGQIEKIKTKLDVDKKYRQAKRLNEKTVAEELGLKDIDYAAPQIEFPEYMEEEKEESMDDLQWKVE